MKNILSLKYDEAKDFLLKNESYINLDLPPYLNFEKLLLRISKELKGASYKGIKTKSPDKLENINYKLLHNKNGKYEWRPFELIHPERTIGSTIAFVSDKRDI
jgi:RNA-directed DNA polymerase